MNITPKLSLNKHPKDCDSLSLVNATNVKVTNDLTLISNEEDLKRNEIIYNTLNKKFGGNGHSIIGAIPCNDEIIIFASGQATSVIARYNEKENKCKIIYNGSLLNNINKIKGTFTYNANNDLIIAISLYNTYTDEPLRVFNLGKFNDTNIDNNQFKDEISSIIPEVKLPSIESHYYVKGSCYKGWTYLYIRFKINKTDYTQWYNFGYPIFVDDIYRQQIFRYCFYQYRVGRNAAELDLYNVDDVDGHSSVPMDGFGTGCYDGFSNNSEISNTTFAINLNFNSFNNFDQYQLGFVCASKAYTKAFTTNDINISNTNYIFNPKYLSEGSITEFITAYYNYYNVKNIINYKNRLYISNYKEQTLNKKIDQSIIDSVSISLKVNTTNFAFSSTNKDTVSTLKQIATLTEKRKDVRSGQEQLKTPKQYFLDINSISDITNQSIPFNKILNVDNSIDLIVKITKEGNTTEKVIDINSITIKKDPSDSSTLPGYCKIKIGEEIYDSIEYCFKTDVDSNGNHTNFKIFDATNYIISFQKKCIDTISSFNDRLKESTLIPGEVYSFYIHYIDKYGHATNGYRINNKTYLTTNTGGGYFIPIKIYLPVKNLTEGYIAVNEEYTLKEFKNVLNSSGNLNIYNINKFNNKLISSGSAASKSDIKNYLLSLYGDLFADNITKYDDIKIANIFNSGNVNGATTGNFGVYINENNERLFKIPEEEYYSTYEGIVNYKYGLRVTVKIPEDYIGYFISYEKFESTKKVTGFLTNKDAREISAIEYNIGQGVTFKNYENNKVSSDMYLYSSTFDIKDSLSTDYNFIRIKAKSTKYCKHNNSGNITVTTEGNDGFIAEISKSDILYRNSSINYAYDLNKSLISYTAIQDKIYPIDNYKLVVADSVKDDIGGLSTAIKLKNIESLFISDDKYRVNTYIASLYNYHNKLYVNKEKTLIRIGNIIYGSGTINTNINDGFNGVYTYDGVIVYNGTGITFNSENNNLYNTRGKVSKSIPDNSDKNIGLSVLDETSEKVFHLNIPFLNYIQFPVIDTYYYESKYFNNNPQNVIFSIMKPDEQDVDAKGYWSGLIVEPKNSIDLFSNPQGSQDDFIPTVYNNYRDDILNITQFDKTIRRSNVIQDESTVNAWRQFPTEGYKNINENKGIITNLVGIGVYLLVHTEHSLFMFNGDATLQTKDKSLQLLQPDAFDTNYVEVFTSDLGFGGLQDDLAFIVDQFGYIFYNNDFTRFYKFDNGQLSLIDKDIYLYLQDNKPTNVRFGNDKFNKRLLISLKLSNNTTKTLSYNYELGNFVSFHDYNFIQGYNTKSKLYLISGNNLYNDIYNFTDAKSYGTYESLSFSTTYPSSISIILNEDYDAIKFLEFIKYNVRKVSKSNSLVSISPVKEGMQPYAGDILEIFSEFTNTGEIDINIDTTNKFNRYSKPWFELGNWNFNYFRNKISTYNGSGSDKLTRIYGNYIVIKFTFDNKDKVCIEFENLNGSVSKQRKL
jgi:hypothetical protein